MKRHTKTRLFLWAAAGLVTVAAVCCLYDRYIMPGAVIVSRSLAVTYVNGRINDAVKQAVADRGIDIAGICVQKEDTSGRVVSVTADGLAVNLLCGDIANNLSEMLNSYSENVIYIKSGAFTGVSLLSNTGFDIPVKIECIGDAEANYDTEIKGIGINQVSFRLFIDVDARVKAYNPVLNDEINIKRRIMLADIIYAGKVPDMMWAGGTK